MKKIIITFAIATIVSVSAFAADKTPGRTVKIAFDKEFSQAHDVEWTTVGAEGVYRAKFLFNNEPLQAFFTAEGEFLGTTRQITKSQLPIMVLSELNKQYADAKVATIFEFSRNTGLDYFITIVTTKGGMILKASANGDLSIYKNKI